MMRDDEEGGGEGGASHDPLPSPSPGPPSGPSSGPAPGLSAFDGDGAPNAGFVYEDLLAPPDATLSLLAFYLARHPRAGEATWRERIAAGQVAIDGRVATDPAAPLAGARRLAYHRPPWREPAAPTDLAIIHDDADLLVVAKPAGLPVLPGGRFHARTVLHLLRGRDGAADAALAPAHRLDRGTSGLVVLTRHAAAARSVGAQFDAGAVRKTYLARCAGRWATPPEGAVVDVAIGRHEHPAWGRVWAAGGAEARAARTTFSTLDHAPDGATTRVALELHTGRPHQARIHAAAAGHPLDGERFYVAGGTWRGAAWPGEDAPPRPGDGGFALHAWRVTLRQPTTGKALTLEAPPPDDLASA